MSVKRKRICVYCGSRSGGSPVYTALAKELATAMVKAEIDLVYGGGRVGLMGVLSQAVMSQGGQVFGVIPDGLFGKEVADTAITDLQVVASMHERKALMEKMSDAFVAIPGGWGTLDEFFEILTWKQIGIHQKPIGLLNHQVNSKGFFDPLLQQMELMIQEGFVIPENRQHLVVANKVSELISEMQKIF